MVDVLKPYNREIQTIKEDLPEILRKILIDKKGEVIRILREDQLNKGLDSDGNVVGTYSDATDAIASSSVSIAKGEGPRKDKIAGQPYNFEWSGGYVDMLDMDFEDFESYTLFSRDKKADFLRDEYGDIDTLTKANNRRVNKEILYPLMIEEIINRLTL